MKRVFEDGIMKKLRAILLVTDRRVLLILVRMHRVEKRHRRLAYHTRPRLDEVLRSTTRVLAHRRLHRLRVHVPELAAAVGRPERAAHELVDGQANVDQGEPVLVSYSGPHVGYDVAQRVRWSFLLTEKVEKIKFPRQNLGESPHDVIRKRLIN